jgi:hypothetical protein
MCLPFCSVSFFFLPVTMGYSYCDFFLSITTSIDLLFKLYFSQPCIVVGV